MSKNNKGFTLAELLITCIIVTLLSVVVASGVSVAAKAYFNVVDKANASTLLSTTLTELRNELSVATNVEVKDNVVIYRSGRSGSTSRILNGENEAGILVREGKTEAESFDRLLVSSQAATKNLHCEFESITYENGIITITNIVVKRNGKDFVCRPEYIIRVG